MGETQYCADDNSKFIVSNAMNTAFVGQTNFIMNGTIRDNVIMDLEFDIDIYYVFSRAVEGMLFVPTRSGGLQIYFPETARVNTDKSPDNKIYRFRESVFLFMYMA